MNEHAAGASVPHEGHPEARSYDNDPDFCFKETRAVCTPNSADVVGNSHPKIFVLPDEEQAPSQILVLADDKAPWEILPEQQRIHDYQCERGDMRLWKYCSHHSPGILSTTLSPNYAT